MFFRKKPVLLNARTNIDVSGAKDLDFAFADLTEICLAPPVYERTELVFRKSRYNSPGDLLRANMLTRGQWLLFVASEFDAEMRNGGLSQFLVNKPGWVDDVPEALDELGLAEARDEYVRLLAELESVIDGFTPSRRNSLMGSLRDMDRLEKELSERTRDSVLEHHFARRRDEKTGRMIWGDDQWSTQIRQRMIAYAQAHPGEFKVLQ